MFWKRGEPQVWASAAALAAILGMVALLVGVVLYNGLGHFWPAGVAHVALRDGKTVLLGERWGSSTNVDSGVRSIRLKTGNAELGPDFRWVEEDDIAEVAYPDDAIAVERSERGNFYGYLRGLQGPDAQVAGDLPLHEAFARRLALVRRQTAEQVRPLSAEIADLAYSLQANRHTLLKLAYHKRKAQEGGADPQRIADLDRRIEDAQAESRQMLRRTEELSEQQQAVLGALRKHVAVLHTVDGREQILPLADVVRFYRPNAMGLLDKLRFAAAKVWELLWENPREANTEGGLFPAIFGTVLMIFLTAVACFPLGVLAGVYLGEYAKDGPLVRIVRIAVNNLAGIPSIVYGMFGLAFFIYGLGGLLDNWLYPELQTAGQKTQVFKSGGILWASLTLGLLTVPVVIVATEEALRQIPRGVREGSLALGATKFQTLWRVLLPMASPGMITGFILAMARAAGEVAPLMVTGLAKYTSDLPLDGRFPYLHLERKFLHLGMHIYDVGFQSPNVEAVKPMVYVTTLLLLLIVLAMTSVAIWLRNRMRRRYQLRTI